MITVTPARLGLILFLAALLLLFGCFFLPLDWMLALIAIYALIVLLIPAKRSSE